MRPQTHSFDVVIAGAGPAGATAAALLAKRGHRVLALERDAFPRYHIGESLLPGTMSILELLGFDDARLRQQFWDKNGASWYWGREGELWEVKFAELGFQRNGLHVVRSQFDQMLRQAATEAGAEVRHRYQVCAAHRRNSETVVVTALDQKRRPFEVTARYFLDATGQRTLLAAPLGLKQFHAQLAHLAVWGYWAGADVEARLPTQTLSAAFDTGWCWFIPLRDGTVSVGVVTHRNKLEALRSQGVARFYADSVDRCVPVKQLLAHASLLARPIRTITDYSYESTTFVTEVGLLVGDAAAFIDPIFSQGVHLAMSAAEQAAAAVHSVLTGDQAPTAAFAKYESFYKEMFSRMRRFVLYFYAVSASRADYFWKAKELLPQALGVNERGAFLALISGQGELLSQHLDRGHYFTAERERLLRHLAGSAAMPADPEQRLSTAGADAS